MQTKENAEKLAEMRRLYENEGLTLARIGEQFGVTRQAVRERLMNAGVVLRRTGPSEKQYEREILEKLYSEEKLTVSDTAKRLGVSGKHIAKELKRHDIGQRSQNSHLRTVPELFAIKPGETIVIERPANARPVSGIHAKAKRAGMKVRVKSIANKLEIYRIS